jgi:hypothetical protein
MQFCLMLSVLRSVKRIADGAGNVREVALQRLQLLNAVFTFFYRFSVFAFYPTFLQLLLRMGRAHRSFSELHIPSTLHVNK